MTDSSLRIVWGWLTSRRRRQLAGLVVLSLVGAAAEIGTLAAVVPFLSAISAIGGARTHDAPGFLVRAISGIGGTHGILAATLVFAAFIIAASSILLALTWANIQFTQSLGHDLGVRVYHRVLHQPYAYHISRNSSEVLAGVEKVTSVVVGVLRPALEGLTALLLATAILIGLASIDITVSFLAILLLGSVYVAAGRISRAKVLQNSREASGRQVERIKTIQEGLGAIRDILLDRSQSVHEARFASADEALRRALVENALWAQVPRHVVEGLGISVVAGLAAWTTSRSGSVGAALPVLGALTLGSQRLLPLVQKVYVGWNQVLGNRGALEDLQRILMMPMPLSSRSAGFPDRLPFTRELRLSHVGFRYSSDGPWVIRDVDLSIPRGARIGIVGETGGGKSTLTDLIMGLLHPSEGSIHVDDVAITEANVLDWQARIAHVPQAIFLADCSVAENIAFGQPRDAIDVERVIDAARRARIHDFVATLPAGYDTNVGERGVRLSGGQRQRIGIARALYRRADLLVLDEATSALDSGTEAAVMESVRSIDEDVTMLIIAHRVSTLEGCDAVVRLANGGAEVVRVSPRGALS